MPKKNINLSEPSTLHEIISSSELFENIAPKHVLLCALTNDIILFIF